jgi:hypothetical protein
MRGKCLLYEYLPLVVVPISQTVVHHHGTQTDAELAGIFQAPF